MEVRLIVRQGKHKDREIPLPPTVFLIGRGQKCHLRPHCRLVSQLHCAIACWAGKVIVRDLKSANGTYVNGTRVKGEIQVHHGDELRVGKLVFGIGVDQQPELVVEGRVRAARATQWLLESPSDSAVLEPASRTCIQPAPGSARRIQPDELALDSDPTAGSGAVSAGEYLRDYIQKKDPLRSPPKAD